MRSIETSLSRMWKVGLSPADLIFLMIVVMALIWLDFSFFHGFCEHMIGVVVISAEDVLVSLGGWDKEPTSGIRVYIFPLLPGRRSKNLWFVAHLARGNCID